jgi:hypothetical protein
MECRHLSSAADFYTRCSLISTAKHNAHRQRSREDACWSFHRHAISLIVKPLPSTRITSNTEPSKRCKHVDYGTLGCRNTPKWARRTAGTGHRHGRRRAPSARGSQSRDENHRPTKRNHSRGFDRSTDEQSCSLITDYCRTRIVAFIAFHSPSHGHYSRKDYNIVL